MKALRTLQSRNIIVVASLAMFVAQFDSALIVVALPEIARDLGVPVIRLSLAITVYLSMLVAMLPLSAWLADRFGARRVFVIAAVLFGLFSLACAFAGSFPAFIAARAAQGVAGALLAPVGRLILLRQTPKAELVDALALTAMPMLIAPTIGPMIGGFIVQHARWEYIFLLNLPVVGVLIALARQTVPADRGDAGRKLDWQGALLVSASLVALLAAIDRIAAGSDWMVTAALFAASAILGPLAWRHLRRVASPILSLVPFAVPQFRTTSFGAGAAIRLPGRAILFALPLLLQLGFGYSPFAAGVLLMVLNGGDLVAKPFVRATYDRFGFRSTIVATSLLGVAALVPMALAGPGEAWLVALVIALAAAGISRSFVFTGMASLSFAGLHGAAISSGNALASISMQFFNALAVAITAALLNLSAAANGRTDPAIADYRIAILALAGLGTFATLLLYRRLPRDMADLHPNEHALQPDAE